VILIPTTVDGKRSHPIAILSDTKEKLKKGIVSPTLFPEVAILDPKLTIGLPPSVTAFTGMDALTHAIESYSSINATDLSDLLAYKAMELLSKNLRMAYAHGENLAAVHACWREVFLQESLLPTLASVPSMPLHIPWRGIPSCPWVDQYIDASLCDALQYFRMPG